MIKRRNLIWLVPLILIVTFPAWRIPVGKFLTPRGGFDPAYAKIDKDAHNFVMETVRILESDEGRITAEIRAAIALTTDVANEYALETVDADIFNENGETTNIKAKNGVFGGDSKLLTLTDDVVVHKLDGDQRLYTDLLYYDDNKQTVHCPGPTRLTGDGIEVKGSSLDYDLKTDQYVVGGRVFTTIDKTITP